MCSEQDPQKENQEGKPAQEDEKEEHACLFWPNAFM